ncbi:MAG: T9SS type A sorting domain-containing protein, partial [Bacteroidia bacterium]|nr:T9SS type A sorting domain-containing protein [Bacteroidia bacterium]
TTYILPDDLGNIAGTSNFSTPNTVYTDMYELNGCLKLRVDDGGGDGLQWWANTAQGAGYVQIKNSNGAIVKTFLNDFGSFFEFSFTTFNPLALNKNELGVGINLFPNPAHNKFVLQGNDLENAEITVSDLLGRVIALPNQKNGNVVEFNAQSLIPGMYLVSVTKGNQSAVKKIIIE